MKSVLLPGEVPAGITFGNRILLVPSVSHTFRHSGDLTGIHFTNSYTWIKRGDSIGEYRISVPKTDNALLNMFLNKVEHKIQIPSPASGLIIHSSYDFADDKHDFSRTESPNYQPLRMAVLLPDDEPPGENGEYMFSELCRCCWNNRWPFLEPSRSWTWGAMTEIELKERLDEQLQLKPHYVDAMPRFESYFRDARTKFPHLRPRLRHLL